MTLLATFEMPGREKQEGWVDDLNIYNSPA